MHGTMDDSKIWVLSSHTCNIYALRLHVVLNDSSQFSTHNRVKLCSILPYAHYEAAYLKLWNSMEF